MKVLEEKKPWSIRVRCTGNGIGGGGCDSLLEANEEDIIAEKRFDLDDNVYYNYYVCCPICGVMSKIGASYLPFRVEEVARGAYEKRLKR